VDVDSFIQSNRDDWQRLDAVCARGTEGLANRPAPEISEAVRLYLRVSTHLTEARSRYADPRLERYLNDLVGRARQAIYAAKPRTLRGLRAFLGVRYREEMRRTAPFIAVAAGMLVVVTLVSWAWIERSAEARLGLIPPAAQEAIRQFSGSRDPSLGPAPALATEILFNNVQVAFLAFALGVAVGVGTVYVLVENAILLGVVAGAFGAAGRGAEFWAVVLPHGLLELTAICIAAGAGLRMGWALIDPGDRARRRAFADEATAAVIVVLGVIPAFVIAALIEGFVSGTEVPAPVQVTLGIVVAAGYVCFLFGWRPRRRRRRGWTKPSTEPAVTSGPPT
jgi:uncharacterized membrane protein SpoIIM required for sporulation